MRRARVFHMVAAVLAAIIGVMAVVAGTQVVLGKVPDYYVIDWLPIYNLVLGIASALFASVVLWRQGRFSLPVAGAIFALHALVMLSLLTVYREVVARDSLTAMSVRLAAWALILVLLALARRKRP